MHLQLRQVAEFLGLSSEAGEAVATGYSVDSRTLQPGDLFFALRGPNHDGHDHVAAAFERGAIAAVVDRPLPGATIRVTDTQQAMQKLSSWARSKWDGVVI